MPLQVFSFPFPETRFFRAGSLIYKFKIRGVRSYSGEKMMEGNYFDQELEDIIRTVLGNLNSLQPFSSTNFNVFPYKKHWEGVSKVMCKHGGKKLKAYPFILFLYLEKNTQNGKQAEEKLNPEKEVSQRFPSLSEPQSKRCKTDSPLEEAILTDLIKDMEAESKTSVISSSQLHMDNPHAERGAKEDPGLADKKGTMEFNKLYLRSGVSTVSESGTPGEVEASTAQDGGGEEEEEEGDVEEEENAKMAPGTSGILTRLASHVFPFSMFFRHH